MQLEEVLGEVLGSVVNANGTGYSFPTSGHCQTTFTVAAHFVRDVNEWNARGYATLLDELLKFESLEVLAIPDDGISKENVQRLYRVYWLVLPTIIRYRRLYWR